MFHIPKEMARIHFRSWTSSDLVRIQKRCHSLSSVERVLILGEFCFDDLTWQFESNIKTVNSVYWTHGEDEDIMGEHRTFYLTNPSLTVKTQCESTYVHWLIRLLFKNSPGSVIHHHMLCMWGWSVYVTANQTWFITPIPIELPM